MSALDNLQTKINNSITQINQARAQLAAQVPNADVSHQSILQSEILSLSLKEAQLQTAVFVATAQDAEVRAAIASVTATTTNINNETANIKDVASALGAVTKILGYVTKILSTIAPFLV